MVGLHLSNYQEYSSCMIVLLFTLVLFLQYNNAVPYPSIGMSKKTETISFIEPTNNVPPKKVGDLGQFTGWKDIFVVENRTCWLTCQVTGFPVPRYL